LQNVRQNKQLKPAKACSEDNAERRQAQTAIEVSEVRYRRLFEAARDGILILDPETRKITDANPFMSELLGYPRGELLGKELWEIGLLKDEEASQSAFRQLQKDREASTERALCTRRGVADDPATLTSGNLHKRIQTRRAFCTHEAAQSTFGNFTSAHQLSTLAGLKGLRGSLLDSRLHARRTRSHRLEFPVPAIPGRRWHTTG
jgi:PAS domain S-box-containing protein